jgi:polyhydroxyalkanoate synthesis regulator phasin
MIFTTLRYAAFIGLGISERAKEVLDELAKKGEANSSAGAKKIRAFFEQGERVEKECNQKAEDIFSRVAQTIRMPSRSDIERLENNLSKLAEKVQGMANGRNV